MSGIIRSGKKSGYQKLEEMIGHLSDEKMLDIANEIHEFQKTGELRPSSSLKDAAETFQISARDVEHYMISELSTRYRTVVLLLMKERAGDFLSKD